MGPDQTVRTAPASQKVGPLLAVTPGPKQTDRASAPLAFVLSSLPVRARATSDALIVHSYLQKHVIPFREVLVFTDLPYSGMWNRSAGTDSWLNLGLRMIDVTRNSGTGFSMPATMTSRRTCGQIVAALNAHVERRHESSL